MTSRRVFWIVSAFVAVLVWLRWPGESRGVGGIVVLGFLALAGCLVEYWLADRTTSPRPIPNDTRPADGRVELATVKDVRSEANEVDSDTRRFVSFTETSVSPTRRAARAIPPLLGRVVIVSLFVGRDGRAWSDKEIADAHKSLRRAGEWIEREAIRWAATVNIDLASTYFAADDEAAEDVEIGLYNDHDAFEANAVPKAIASASRAAAKLGFADVGDLIERVGPRIEADVRVWLLHLRRAGRSMAAAEVDSGLPGVNLAVCYAREENFPEPLAGPPYCDPITVVHELFHLFGARDKYDVPLGDFAPKSVTERDVMRLDTEVLSRLKVDPLTATEIGWAELGQSSPPETTDARRTSGRGERRG